MAVAAQQDDWSWITLLPEGSPERKEAEELAAQVLELREQDPLQFFWPHGDQQREFFEARTRIVAAFAGNGFGKSTALVARSLIECIARERLPERLRQFKTFDAPCHGWLLCPTEEKIYDSLKPAFEQWTPKSEFLGGSWGKSYNGSRLMLTFANGSTIAFKTYKQDPSTLGGASLHFVGYDEPPPREHRDECVSRLRSAANGYEMYAMTPLKTNTGWVKRDIYKKRESPYITVVRGSIHDNPMLDQDTKTFILSQFQNDMWRQAREFGDFVDVGGLIYADFERCVVDRYTPSTIGGMDFVVGIDPGIRNAAIIFGAFDNDNVCHIFDELLLQDRTPHDYAVAIRAKLDEWMIPKSGVLYVIDPAARARAQTNAESVETALAREGIYCAPGQNQVEAGIQQVRTRLQHRRLLIGKNCVGLRDEADEYAAEDRPDGEFKPIKENDHRLDALRYLCMARAWDPVMEEQSPDRTLGAYGYGEAPPADVLEAAAPIGEGPPLGAMS